jgi:hypothetical protein
LARSHALEPTADDVFRSASRTLLRTFKERVRLVFLGSGIAAFMGFMLTEIDKWNPIGVMEYLFHAATVEIFMTFGLFSLLAVIWGLFTTGAGSLIRSIVRLLHRAMNIRYALILAVTTGLFLIGCTTTRDERHVERLIRHRSWSRIQQIAKTEVKKREILWPVPADYIPMEHNEKIWAVTAMTGTPKGDVQRVVMMMIGDDGKVLAYQRYWEGHLVTSWPER